MSQDLAALRQLLSSVTTTQWEVGKVFTGISGHAIGENVLR